jgi:WD40 repeat protein
MCIRVWLLVPFVLAATGATAVAQQAPGYAKDVRPFLARYCLECHNAKRLKGGLDLETYKGLQEGSDRGPAVVPGKPDQSPLVLLPEGKKDPKMPPKKAQRHPRPAEVAVLRAWVAAGAKDDSASVRAIIPDIKPRVPAHPAVAALAYRPDGKLLAAGGYKEAVLLDPATGDLVGRLPGQTAAVTALAFSPDGRRLAVASGTPGAGGEVRLYAVSPDGRPEAKRERTLTGHQDVMLGLAFSPDGKTLATGGYDRLVILWDVTTGKAQRTFKEHSDSVYGVAFRPDGKWLASAAADRAVKIWDVAAGKLLYTLGEATDWVYAVAWSPDGRHLAAGGVDKSIRVWEVTPGGVRVVNSVFAHEAAVIRLEYAADGTGLYSLGEDRTVKAWDPVRMVEPKVYPKQPEATLALAVRRDHKQLALGRYDGAAVLVEEANGKVQAEPLPVKPKPPQLSKLSPGAGQRGRPVRVRFEGKQLDGATEVVASHPGVTAKILGGQQSPTSLVAEVLFPAATPPGVYQLRLKNAAGQSPPQPFAVDPFPEVKEAEPNNSPRTGQKITLPATVVGSAGQTGDVDFYRFEARAGQQVGVTVIAAAAGSKLDPFLELTDAAGRLLAESTEGTLGYTFPAAGTYTLGIRDRDFRGGAAMHYRLHVGDLPVVTAVFPLGLQRGTEADIAVEGVHLGGPGGPVNVVRAKVAADAAPGTRLPLPLGGKSVVVGEFPEVIAGRNASAVLRVPGTANGRILQAGAADTWRFPAKKGQRLIVEVEARRLGSPLDSTIEILDAKGQPVPRAVLRCLAKTYVTFRDHDSATPGIRLDTWNELAMNDYLYVGNELVRIFELPRNPDDDCQFYSRGKKRVSFLDTTPTHHAVGTPMYKVSIHPPGTTFAPNGFPVFTLYYRNDDGGPGYGRDSRLFFDPPADGDYQVRIGDARGQGGRNYAYRLIVRPPRPSFTVSVSPTSPAVWRGGAVPVTVSADRLDGYEGPIALRLENTPPGFSAPVTSIPTGENSTALALYAEPSAMSPAKAAPLKVVARAMIDGREVVEEATGGVPRVQEPGDIVTTTQQSEVVVRPGGQVTLTVHVERRNGFAGRIPLDVRGLPHGVRVLDIGLNGILITERETTRTFVIYCEPWVEPQEHPFVVLARREGKNTEHAAKSVLLKVAGPAK